MLTVKPMKHCWRCKKDLPITSFWKDKGRKDGFCHACKDCMSKVDYDWRKRNKERVNLRTRTRRRRCVDSWRGYFSKFMHCECCGKTVHFSSGSSKDSICFDHRRGGEAIKGQPTNWLQSTIRTPASQLLWESCDFGKLCQRCNSMLPSKNRKEFIRMVMKYADV